MAQELDIPVIALAQLNRDYEKTGSERKPRLSDLRDSGSIEQDADCCMFLYENNKDGNEGDRRINCLIAKNRNGEPNKDAYFEFQPEYTKFVPLSPVDR